MVGLSYSGITQLYTAATNPPHLAGVVAQSVIADPWLQAWPGGIFNSGFTQQWIKERNAASVPGRIELGHPAHRGRRHGLRRRTSPCATRTPTSRTWPAA